MGDTGDTMLAEHVRVGALLTGEYGAGSPLDFGMGDTILVERALPVGVLVGQLCIDWISKSLDPCDPSSVRAV